MAMAAATLASSARARALERMRLSPLLPSALLLRADPIRAVPRVALASPPSSSSSSGAAPGRRSPSRRRESRPAARRSRRGLARGLDLGDGRRRRSCAAAAGGAGSPPGLRSRLLSSSSSSSSSDDDDGPFAADPSYPPPSDDVLRERGTPLLARAAHHARMGRILAYDRYDSGGGGGGKAKGGEEEKKKLAWSYREVLSLSSRLHRFFVEERRKLEKDGGATGDGSATTPPPPPRIAFLCPPGPLYLAVQFAAWSSGAIAVPLCATHPPSELAYVLSDCAPSLAIDGASTAGNLGGGRALRKAARDAGVMGGYVCLDDVLGDFDAEDAAREDRAVEGGASEREFEVGAGGDVPSMDHPALIIYTSGEVGSRFLLRDGRRDKADEVHDLRSTEGRVHRRQFDGFCARDGISVMNASPLTLARSKVFHRCTRVRWNLSGGRPLFLWDDRQSQGRGAHPPQPLPPGDRPRDGLGMDSPRFHPPLLAAPSRPRRCVVPRAACQDSTHGPVCLIVVPSISLSFRIPSSVINKLACAIWAGASVEFVRFNPIRVWERLAAATKRRGEGPDSPPDGGSEGGSATPRAHLPAQLPPGPTLFMAVPTIYAKMLEVAPALPPDVDPREAMRRSEIRLMVSGSAALPTGIFNRWKELTGHTLLERYGMSEFAMALSNPLEPVEGRIPGYVGTPLPSVEVKIVDEDTGDAIPNATTADELPRSGELCVRGPTVFCEYWQRPHATAESFDFDGYFKTGDVAEYDPSKNSYHILGRVSADIIKSAGHKLSSLQIERSLLEHPSIVEAVVLGVPDDTYGERVGLICRLVPGETELDLEGLRRWSKDHLAAYKIPTRMIVMEKDIPKNAMGKVAKKQLVNMFEDNDNVQKHG
ncbi:hypothetical protein ACHAWF_014246 [Thalassiosira exigua]